MTDSHSPIGVFDSGIGGLTAVRELVKLMPNEDIIYLGDTARVPYGTRAQRLYENTPVRTSIFFFASALK